MVQECCYATQRRLATSQGVGDDAKVFSSSRPQECLGLATAQERYNTTGDIDTFTRSESVEIQVPTLSRNGVRLST